MNNITNVVLDRDKGVVTYDTSVQEGSWDYVVYSTATQCWECKGEPFFVDEINGYLGRFPYVGDGADQQPTPDYYNKTFKGGKIDFYRIAKAYGITDPCHQHALKKFLRATNKGDITTDLELIEVIEGILARWKEMLKEDAE